MSKRPSPFLLPQLWFTCQLTFLPHYLLTLKMQTWSLSKLLLIISLLNIIPSVDCQGYSASWRSEACCGSELHNFWLWIRESCIGHATRFLHQDRALILLVAGCSQFQPCLKLPSAKGGCLSQMTDENGEWRGNTYSTPLTGFGTTPKDQPNSRVSCVICWGFSCTCSNYQAAPGCSPHFHWGVLAWHILPSYAPYTISTPESVSRILTKVLSILALWFICILFLLQRLHYYTCIADTSFYLLDGLFILKCLAGSPATGPCVSPMRLHRPAHYSPDDRCSLRDGKQGAHCKGIYIFIKLFRLSLDFFYRISLISPNCAPVHMAATGLNPILYFLI